jgi:hypothetical protein
VLKVGLQALLPSFLQLLAQVRWNLTLPRAPQIYDNSCRTQLLIHVRLYTCSMLDEIVSLMLVHSFPGLRCMVVR